MISDVLIYHQRVARLSYVNSLHELCARRFRDAAMLVGADLEQWPALRRWTEHRADLTHFDAAWKQVCDRYNAELYDPQLDLFLKEPPDEVFSRFVHWRLWPVLASDNECARNVLRVAGTLPCHNPADAGAALSLALAEWPLQMRMQIPE